MNANKIIETRYYNTDHEGIVQVNFREFGAEVISKKGTTNESNYAWYKQWYPQIIADLKADPLPVKFSIACKNGTRWVTVR
jgi:predicted choloylglycine hydrolase